jgi:hypothetical protein
MSTSATAMLNPATLSEIMSVPLPQETSTYMPVPHDRIVEYVSTDLVDMLPQFQLKDNTFGLSRDGKCLFGMASFRGNDGYIGPSIAYRNSYDKSISVGFAFGAQVFVCANGMFTGDIVVAKKHTLNVWQSVKQLVQDSVHKVGESYVKMLNDIDTMREKPMCDTWAWEALGVLRGQNVLSPRVYEKALKEWHEPTYKEHKDGTSLQLYNACTEAFKMETSPNRAMKKRIELHDQFLSLV